MIDFSPLYRPAQYAEAILVCDAAIWESAPMSLVEEGADGVRRQMLVRACLFRLYVAAIAWRDVASRLTIIAEHHEPLTAWLRRGRP